MPTTPLLPSSGLVTFDLVAGGKSLDSSIYQVHTITVTKGINRISEARIELVDGDPATGDFTATDSSCFKPGQPIEVQAGYDAINKPIFKGIVVSLGLATRGGQGTVLTVLCKDEAVKMNGNRVIKPFPPKPTSSALQEVLSHYEHISASIASTTGVQNNLVQYNTTDWDFVVTQAEANGQVVISDMGKLATLALATAASASVALVYGTNAYDFSLRIDARTQFASVTAQAWSAARQQELKATASPPSLTLPGDLTSAELATAVGQKAYTIRTAADVDQPTLQALASALVPLLATLLPQPPPPACHPPQPAGPPPEAAELPAEPAYINNAGLVLLWPFLTPLFERLGYLEQRQLKSPALADRAVHLLHFLATGEENPAEHLLVINKLLCGVPHTRPTPHELPLTTTEKTTGEDLLRAVIGQWSALKSTSIAGLRQTFLQRPGKLHWQAERVTLTVQTQTVDILVDRLPWSISLIKLPWMALPCYVTWR